MRSRQGVGTVALVVVVVVIIVVAGIAIYNFLPSSKSNVLLLLNYTPTASDSFVYYGVQQGYFASQGINASIIGGSTSASTVSEVSTGKVSFGFVPVSEVVQDLDVANITNVRIVGLYYTRSFDAVTYNEADVKNFSGLQNVPWTSEPASGSLSATPLFYYIAKTNGLNVTKLKANVQNASSTVGHSLFVEGKVDFNLGTLSSYPELAALAASSGIRVGYFPFYSYGAEDGFGLVTNTATIQSSPSLVKGMVYAMAESMIASAKDPQAAAAAIVESQPQLNYTLTEEAFQLEAQCCVENSTSTTPPLQFAYMNPAAMNQTVDWLSGVLGLKTPVPAREVYTNQFTTPPP